MQTVEQKLKEIASLYDSRKFVESQKLCDEILAEDSQNTEAFRYKCKSLIGLGKYSEVNRIAGEAAKTNPDAKFVLYYQGVSLYEMNKYQASLSFFEKAIKLYPDWDFPYNGYGRSLEAVGRHEEAIKNFQKSFDLDPTDPGPLLLIANNLQWREKKEEALKYYNKVLEINPDHLLTLCNRGELFSSLGRNKEALEDFKRVQKLVDSGQIDARLTPGNMEFITTTLKAIVQLENLFAETEANIKKADQNNPVVKRMIEHVKLLAKQKDQATTQLIAKKDDANSAETQKLMKEMERIKQEFSALNAEVINLRADVKKLESKYDEIKNELETKMDDFYKKLDNELARLDVLPEDQIKIKEYFKAFIETFSSIHVTSQVVDSGQVKLDAVNTKATLLSMVASFTPFIGNILSTGIKSLTEFIQSREMKINARKMKGLASDASALSQLIGKAGYQIVLDKQKQKQICTITKQDLDKISGTTLERVIKFCENLAEDFDSYMYTNLYPTPAARLGHIDANDLIEEWINEKIDRYGIVEDFVKKTTTPKESKNDANSASPKKEITPVTRSACCNMF